MVKMNKLFKHLFVLFIITGFAFIFIGCQKSEDNSKLEDTENWLYPYLSGFGT